MFLDLPRISVIGNQSAGKSSLVEAVTGINVPREANTCTRCPMECTLTRAATWSCTITLRFEFDSSGRAYSRLRTESFGERLTNKSGVEIWLRRAQAAILCPHIPTSEFLTKSKEDIENMQKNDTIMHQFSKNVIHLDVEDPEFTGLSFMDLPGLIQNSADPSLINLVRNLVECNIKGDNTLILITIPMGDDIENQQAVRLAKEADPMGERTIGVLTKPDMVLPGATGSMKRWKDVLEGQIHPLKHGYYCVRLLDDEERSKQLSRAELERSADEFFRTRTPWSELQRHNRFGVPNLVKDVSTLLMMRIEKNLPSLRKQVAELLVQCSEALNSLPPPPNDPRTEILLRVGELTMAFHDAVMATNVRVLAQRTRERYLQYKMDLLRTSPDFRPFVEWREYMNPPLITGDPDERIKTQLAPMDLEDVRKVIKESIGWELPRHVPFAATTTLVLRSTRLWRAPSFACFNDIYDTTFTFIEDLVRTHFGRFPEAEKHIRVLVNQELENCKNVTEKAIEMLLQLETLPLYTQNIHYLQIEEDKWYNHLKNIRLKPSEYRLTLDDYYSDELILMARVQAYFRVAYKRIVDYLPLTIEHSLHHALDHILYERLLANLIEDLKSGDKLKILLEESHDTTAQRRALTEKKQRLLEIKQRLEQL
ncbi:hypothetical protein AMATHDRAFT_150299 [Amanita thiersii Skay4041]|uniref:GED domain-containing protein n=1 Tax=Amanita thiersii Skay4041 TaxID=703135 RepID=A0A2A9NB53_9AGAR|nr:hypothetical protein AMATHDRAFT_150299 [Amanita thiersii Skay4041]